MSDYIPDELFPKILSYLPAKSLVRFNCVCKSWHSLITSSDFITAHLNQTKLSNNNLGHYFLRNYSSGETETRKISLHIDNDTFDLYHMLDFPFPHFELRTRMVGSINGLICLTEGYRKEAVFLWNPSIRKCLTLPNPQFGNDPQYFLLATVCGFGFDSRTNDYKVVRLVYLKLRYDGSVHSRPMSLKVELYKLSTGCWETNTTTINPNTVIVTKSYLRHTFINGSVHWLAGTLGASNSGLGDFILSFDMSDEVFRKIMLPTIHDMGTYFGIQEIHVTVCGEWLSFFHFRKSAHCSWSVWAMKEYGVVESWTKLYTAELNGDLEMVLGFRYNQELILAKTNGELVSYDSKTQQIKYLVNPDLCEKILKGGSHHLSKFKFNIGAYVESLVLLADGEQAGDNACKEENAKQALSSELGMNF